MWAAKKLSYGQNGGGGSGAGTGGYPSEVTSDADKFAWDLWSYLLANGYSKAAAAGILEMYKEKLVQV